MQRFPVGYVEHVRGGQLIEGLMQGRTAIFVGAEGKIDVGAAPVTAHRPGAVKLHPVQLGKLLPQALTDRVDRVGGQAMTRGRVLSVAALSRVLFGLYRILDGVWDGLLGWALAFDGGIHGETPRTVGCSVSYSSRQDARLSLNSCSSLT